MPLNRVVDRPVILGIVGDSAAGKTTFTQGLGAGLNVDGPVIVLDRDGALEDDGELVELRLLRRLVPACRGQHVRHGHHVVAAGGVADVLLDQLPAGDGDERRGRDELRHRRPGPGPG